MDSPQIFTLTSYCWHEIFKQIKLNCETSDSLRGRYKLVKYLDLINFAISLECITKAFKQWNPQLYEELDIENTFLNTSPRIQIDLSSRYEAVQRISERDKNIFWKSFVSAIEENERLECINLIYKPKQFCPDHFDRFESLVNALKDKKTLQSLDVAMKGYTLENVPDLGNLRILCLDVRMDAEDLIELCRSNPRLRFLNFKSTELYGRLSDIVPHCNRLVELNLTLKPEVDAKEYAPLAKLPRLKKLKLNGSHHQEGTLVDLFKGLKLNNLDKILIPDILLSKEETQALAEINSLTLIKGAFRDIPSIENLSRLPSLKYLSIKTQSEQSDLVEPLIDLITRTCVEIMTDSFRFFMYFTEEDGVLRLKFDLPKDIEENTKTRERDLLITHFTVSLCQRLAISQLILQGDFSNILGETMFGVLASKRPQILQKLILPRDKLLSVEEANALATIQSLKVIFCVFKHLERIISIKIQQLNGLTENAKRVDKIKTEQVEIRLQHDSDNKVTLTLFFFGIEIDHKIFAPLTNLHNLRRVEIKGRLINGSPLGTLFRSLNCENLQELQVPIVEPDELLALSQITSLKVLSCGLYCSRNIEHLADIKHLECLTLTVHPKGSLKTLFQLIASQEDQVLLILNIQHIALTSEEIFQVSRIKSLERVSLGRKFTKLNPWITEKWQKLRSCQRCLAPPENPSDQPHNKEVTLSCSQNSNEAESVASKYSGFLLRSSSKSACNWEPLADLPNLKELCLHAPFKTECLQNLLRKLCQPDHQKLCKFSLTLCPVREEGLDKAIEQIGFLQNLTDLYLENSEGYVLMDLLDLLQTSLLLRSLMLNRTYIDYEESLRVGRIKNLEKLLVGFSNEDSFLVVTKLSELKDFHLNSPHKNIVNKLMPILRTCRNLKSIFLTQNLSQEFIDSFLETLKSVREPSTQGPLILRAQLKDADYPVQLNNHDSAYLNIEQEPIDDGFLKTEELEMTAMFTLWSRWW